MNCSRKNTFVPVENFLVESLSEGSAVYLWDIQNDTVRIEINNHIVYNEYVSSMPQKHHGMRVLSLYRYKNQKYIIDNEEQREVSNIIKMNTIIGTSSREDIVNLDTIKTILLYHDKRNKYIAIETLDRVISFE